MDTKELWEQSQSQLFTRQGETLFVAAGQNLLPELTTQGNIIWPNGTVIDKKYRILGLVGMGGMGAVYRVHHELLNKDLALKTFRAADYFEDSWKRFQNEAKILASLRDAHIVDIYDFGFAENKMPYYTMELLQGENLEDKLKREGSMRFNTTMHAFIQACRGLHTAHKKGILHRDVKPANFFLQSSAKAGERAESDSKNYKANYSLKVLDFGIADLLTREAQATTGQGAIFGSPLYMSPEQADGRSLTAASDIYSLGCALYQCLCGEPPFYGATALDTIILHQTAPPPPLSVKFAGEVPARLDGLVYKMLAKHPEKRFESIKQVEAELEILLKAEANGTSFVLNNSTFRPPTEQVESRAQNTGEQKRKRQLSTLILVAASLGVTVMAVSIPLHNLFSQAKRSTPLASAIETGDTLPDQAKVRAHHYDPNDTDPSVITMTKAVEATTGKQFFDVLKEKSPIISAGLADEIKYNVTTSEMLARGKKQFVFPAKQSIGSLTYKLANSKEIELDCLKSVTVPANASLLFQASLMVRENPLLLRGFAPNDLDMIMLKFKDGNLLLDEEFGYDKAHIKEISRLTSIQSLFLSLCDVTSEILPDINKLKNLTVFSICGVKKDASWLAKMDRLPKLTQLSISECNGAAAVIRRLAKGSSVISLDLDHCNLKASDLKELGKITELRSLNLSQNLSLTDADIKHLENLKFLNDLDVSGLPLTSASFSTFAKFKYLTLLHISKKQFSPEEQLKLKAMLPPQVRIDIVTQGSNAIKEEEEQFQNHK